MPLQTGDLEQLERSIRERRRQLEAELRADVAQSRENNFGDLTNAPADLGDESVADLITDLTTAELTRDLEEWRELRDAESRIDNGSYGACVACGRDIPFERLKVQPAALRCLQCQELHEKTHAGTGEPTL